MNYENTLKKFDTIVSAATVISQGTEGRPSATSQHFYASLLFTRLCTTGVSLLLSLPKNRFVIAAFEHWDFCAVASQARNLIECYIAFYYLCVENVSNEEWDCRWNIFNLHDCLRRQKMLKYFGTSEQELLKFEEQAEELRTRLRTNQFFCSIASKMQQNLLKANTAYLVPQDEIVDRLGVDVNIYRGLYIFLSSQIHTFPLGFYRMADQNRGRGLENETEKNYICMTIDFTSPFISRACREMIDLFPNADEKLSVQGREAVFKTDTN